MTFVESGLRELQQFADASDAVTDGALRLNYRTFATCVSAVALKVSRQTRREDVVAIAMERSAEFLVAMCACLHAGRCFVPVRPSGPVQYSEELLRTSGARLLLLNPRNVFAGEGEIPQLVVDIHALINANERAEVAKVLPQEVAYLMYTSGSTGRPKPVMISRGGLDNYLAWAASHYRMSELRGAIAQLSPTFDACLTQTLLPVLARRHVRVVPVGAEISSFSAFLEESTGAWLLKVTPSQLLAIAAEYAPKSFEHLTGELVVGGEAMLGAHVKCARQLLPHVRIHNEYGPTETVVGSAIYTVPDAADDSEVPIGAPITDTKILIVDELLQRRAGRDHGEILIGGAGVAHGYLGLAAATARAFVPDPVPGQPGARVYRTGDYGFCDENGQLRYIGRVDGQVKIRGQRVELGDVQQRIAALPGVAAAAIVTYGDTSGLSALAAYVQPTQGIALGTIREHAALTLPASALPSRWHEVSHVPLTAHGKIDYTALDTAIRSAPAAEHETDVTLAPLRAIWRDVLGHDNFTAKDSFLAVGGHSILVVRLRSRVKRTLGVEVSLADLVRTPTLEGMAAALQAAASTPNLPTKSETTKTNEPFELCPAQQQIWLASARSRANGLPDAYLTPAAARLVGALNVETLREAVSQAVYRHGVFRLQFLDSQPPAQQFGTTPRYSWSEETLPDESGVVSRLTALARATTEDAPLLRVCVLTISDTVHHLFLCAHHLVSDQWSMQVLAREICAAYRGDQMSSAVDFSFRDFCVQQNQLARDSQNHADLRYWREKLQGTLPDTARRVSSRTMASARVPVVLSTACTQVLEARARVGGITTHTLTLSLAAIAMGLLHEIPIVRFASPVTARDPAYENTVGCLLNTVSFTVTLNATERLAEVLTKTRADVAEALGHIQLPHSVLQEHLPLLASGELAHARFVFLEDLSKEIRLPGCTAEAVPIPPSGSKFDLMISAQHREDRLHFALDFDPEAYARAQMEGLSRALTLVGEALAHDPGITLRQLQEKYRQQESRALAARSASLAASLAQRLSGSNGTNGTSSRPIARPRVSRPGWLKGAYLIESVARTPLVSWSKDDDAPKESLRKAGAVLLRGFSVTDPADFERAISYITSEPPCDYENRSTPRQRVMSNVFTSTEYPSSETIPLHNENSYSHRWPACIAFLCVQPAARGGETPIADSRRVYETISAETRAEFESREVAYVRNYGAAGLSWQETFQTPRQRDVDEYCRTNGIQYEWRAAGQLHTRQTLPATRRHPRTAEAVWFNQAHLFHVSSLGNSAEHLLRNYGARNLPRNAEFGDGEAIPESMLNEIRAAYADHALAFPWQRGDVLILDNLLWAHGRRPFSGERRVLVTMTRGSDTEA